MPRLNKVLQELNIGFDTVKECLRQSFGVTVSSINEKISEEHYTHLICKYKDDMVLHNVIKKTFATRSTKKNPQGVPAIYNDEEKIVLQSVGDMLKVTPQKIWVKYKRGKHKKKLVRKGGIGSNGRNSRSLTYYPYKFIRIISVPFGGQGRR